MSVTGASRKSPGALPASDLALGEVQGALLEFKQARTEVVNAVHAAMRDGCSKQPPKARAVGIIARWTLSLS